MDEFEPIGERRSPALLLRATLWLVVLGTAFYAGSVLRQASVARSAAASRDVTPRGPLNATERATIELFREEAPAVVFITTLERRVDFFRRQALEVPRGSGSGFIWDEIGHVVTNYHVVSGRGTVRAEVTLADQSTWDAKVVGWAADKDLAVLKIDAPRERLHPIKVGTSADLQVGQTVLAIGNPFGLDQTLTTGVISAVGREIMSLDRLPIRDAIQTDAAINPGNSGGPLLDSAGRLIGVNTQIYSPSGASAGIGFAIPADTVNWVVPDLIRYGEIRRPILGVELADDQYLRRLGIEGALIFRVTPGTGAAKAGLLSTRRARSGDVLLGDIITAIDGEPVKSSSDVFLLMERHEPGDIVQVTVLRDRESIDQPVELGAPRGR